MVRFAVVLLRTTALRAQARLSAMVMGLMVSLVLDLLWVTAREKRCERKQCHPECWKLRLFILLVDLKGLGGFLITLALGRGQEFIHRKQRARQDALLVLGQAGS